ncbi:MAG: pyruvate kinase [Thermodesulfobacteriota bacterium]
MGLLSERRRTKIVCTVGPAITPEIFPALVAAGLNVARLNFSHGSQAEYQQRIDLIRSTSRDTGQPVAILQDLAGPKLRLGVIDPEPIYLVPDQTFTLTKRSISGNQGVSAVNTPEVIDATPVGASVLLADGALELKVVEKGADSLTCRVVVGGALSSHKGVNLPGVPLPISALTDKDRDDLNFGLDQGVDLVALSFVRSPEDVQELKDIISGRGLDTPVIAKIEKPEAVERIKEILAVADGIMVARGDLGVETPLKRVPIVQKMLIDEANRIGKPVITATQMLASMVDNPRPTRAEVTDVANAILDGTDAVMLSEETAIGKYPVDAVRFLDEIARTTEATFPYEDWLKNRRKFLTHTIPDAISLAAVELAQDLKAKVIMASTASGATARLISRFRPAAPIIAVTSRAETKRRLCLSWGVSSFLMTDLKSVDQMLDEVKAFAVSQGYLASGDRLVITAGTPLGTRGATNLIKADSIA